ncbi:hypothetical protein [Brevibacillus laterosporus]|uniref:hypothetical protein n=1 Tax=Brevibacillus laterosporus TaxID=1465 RepID=UPI0012DD9D40|nr:hypothetical protein [Brevibacillus laterosporus]
MQLRCTAQSDSVILRASSVLVAGVVDPDNDTVRIIVPIFIVHHRVPSSINDRDHRTILDQSCRVTSSY